MTNRPNRWRSLTEYELAAITGGFVLGDIRLKRRCASAAYDAGRADGNAHIRRSFDAAAARAHAACNVAMQRMTRP